MNLCKKLLAMAAWVLPLASFAQNSLEITFEESTQNYQAVGVYDWWEESPFRKNPDLGNCAVVTNPDASLAPEDCANTSDHVVGFQRYRAGSNMFGIRIDLKPEQRFELTPTVKYVHVLMKKPVDGRSMLIGLGKHNENTPGYQDAWAEQKTDVEQFTITGKNKAPAGQWTDVVFPIKGAGNIDIYSLVIVPDCEDPLTRDEDFIVYIDDIRVNTSAAPSVALVGDYPVCFEKDQTYTKTDRKLNSFTLTNAAGTNYTKQASSVMYTEAFDSFIPVKKGEQVRVQMNYTGSYMHSFYYLDKDNNGKFDEATELVTYCNNKAAGYSEQQSFTIPADLKPGIYRLRGKVDWQSTDPAGNQGDASGNNFIVDNRGAIIDVLLNVYDPATATVTVGNVQRNGAIVLPNDASIDDLKQPRGTSLQVKAQPSGGFDYAGMIVTTGYGIGIDSLVHSNPQYLSTTISWREFDENDLCTIPAQFFYADVMIEGLMEPLGNVDKNRYTIVEGLKISPAPVNGRFDSATVWYTLANHQSSGYRYISTGSSYMADGYFVTDQATKDETDAGLWCIVADGNGAYKFYNRATGTSKVLGTNVSGDKSAMVDAASTTNTLFTFNERTAGGGVWNIKNGTSGNNYWCGSNNTLGHWANNAAANDNNCRWVFEETEVTEPIVPEVSYFSAPDGPYTYWGLKFNSGDYYISETDDNALLKTTGTAATSWALVGTKESFVLRSSTGQYVGINSNEKCISVATAEEATEFAFFNEDTEAGTFMIVRKGQKTDTGFNPWGGNATGNPIGFWNTNDANDKLVFVEVEQPVIDTPSLEEAKAALEAANERYETLMAEYSESKNSDIQEALAALNVALIGISLELPKEESEITIEQYLKAAKDLNDAIDTAEEAINEILKPVTREDVVPSITGYKVLAPITEPAQLKSGKYFVSVYSKEKEGLLYGNAYKNVSTEKADVDETLDNAYVWTVEVDEDGTFTLTSSQGKTLSVQGATALGKHNVKYTDEDSTPYDAAKFSFNPTTIEINGVNHWMIHQQNQMDGAKNATDDQKLAYLHCNCSNPGLTDGSLRISYWEGYDQTITGSVTCDKIAFYPAKAVYDKEATIYNLVHVVELAQDNDADLDDIETTVNVILEK